MHQVISTFSGIGGSSQGYKQAGLNVIASVEFLDYQAANYRLNHPTTKVYQEDIRKLDPRAILKEIGLAPGELDIFDGSPPCSSFSTAGLVSDGWGKEKAYGNRKQRTDDLFWEYIRFLEAFKPKVFVAENVSGLIKGASKGHFNEFMRAFDKAGYRTNAKLMNAANYGVPQKRERIIFQGVRKDLNREPVFPTPFGKVISVENALRGITFAKVGEVVLSESQLQHWKMTRPGYSFEDAHKKLTGKTGWYSRIKVDAKQPINTITAHADDLYHWSEPRRFYVDELKVLQSFPINYQLMGSYDRQIEGIGRSVPPKMMEAIARTIVEKVLKDA